MSRWNVFCTLAEGPVSARHLMNSGCGSEAEPRDERAFWEAHVLDAERQGFRTLELHSDGQITTEVVWIKGD
jgi:hypothetical protein